MGLLTFQSPEYILLTMLLRLFSTNNTTDLTD